MPKLKTEKEQSPLTQKIILFTFGIGPILIMGWFLGVNGFFSPPGS